MPPTRHSTSTAHKESDQIPSDQNYPLGDYSFRIERTSVPGSTNDKIEAICTDKDGKNARKSIQLPSSTQLDGWYVEANETEATVYALVQVPIGDDEHLSPSDWGPPEAVPSGGDLVFTFEHAYPTSHPFRTGLGFGVLNYYRLTSVSVSNQPLGNAHSYTYNGLTAYYYENVYIGVEEAEGPIYAGALSTQKAAWTILYGVPTGDEYETKEIMIGRFPIDLEDAGGVGPGSDWIDPGDYDPDWEEGDPTHTLYVTVTGALSGRHNDPIEDPSYSYIPADKDTVKDYGCGGDGGHGGGGGAGASTVVVHKFATNQANSKEVTAIARRHGYGSGGGKGGKGGDGCILVYY